MQDIILNNNKIRELLSNLYNDQSCCGFEAFVVMKGETKLKTMAFSEEKNSDGKSFRDTLKEMIFLVINDNFLSPETEYIDGTRLADDQHKFLIIKQEGEFYPFSFLNNSDNSDVFHADELSDATGLIFKIRKGMDVIWCYQHLWSIMVPNKKRTNLMTRILKYEDQTFFEEQKDALLTISKKIDILIINGHLITSNTTLLQKNFGFQDYIYQSAEKAVSSIAEKNLVANAEKLTEYIGRGKTKYAKKMMRIGNSKVLSLNADELFAKIKSVDRWKDKFNIDETTQKIVLETYEDVEYLIDLFDERFTRSDITDTEYDTDVKTVAQPA